MQVSLTYFHLYHYASNNPVRYTDPDGRVCGTIFDIHKYKYGIYTYDIGRSKAVNVLCTFFDAYPFGIGKLARRVGEIGACYEDIQIIDESKAIEHYLNKYIKYIDYYNKANDVLTICSFIFDLFDCNSKLIGTFSKGFGKVGLWVILPASLLLDLFETDSIIIDNMIVSLFKDNMYSDKREGVVTKYKYAREELHKLIKEESVQLQWSQDHKQFSIDIKNQERVDEIKKKLDEME